MQTRKNDTFEDRRATAANARNAMLARFRARPGPDDPAVIERQAAQAAIAAAREIRIAERKVAREAEMARQLAEQAALAAEQKAKAAEQAARDVEAAKRAAALVVEQKEARDARYAARKARRR
jgi:Family of unknown function (DUF6481)